MSGIGGSVESVVLKGRRFTVAGDADSNRKLGGFENEIEPNGDGSARVIKARMSWQIDGLALSIDDLADDLEYLQGLSDANELFTILISYASGARYEGQGQITGELQVASQNTTAPVTLKGSGKLTRQ
jgi:hypothetical protein